MDKSRNSINARLKLTVTSPVQSLTEPLTVTEMKPWCNVPDADMTQDSLIESAIASARAEAELRQGRDLVAKQWDLTLDCIPECIQTRDNLTSVDLFKYRDSDGAWTTLVEGTDYIVDTAKNVIVPPYNDSWPSFTPYPSSAVLVRYTVTPPALDQRVLRGMRCLVIMEINGDATPEKYAAAYRDLESGRVERV